MIDIEIGIRALGFLNITLSIPALVRSAPFSRLYSGISDARCDLGSPLACCFRCCFADAAVLAGAGLAHCPSATRAHQRVLDTASRLTAIHARQGNGSTFNGSLAGSVAFRDDPHFAAELHRSPSSCLESKEKALTTLAFILCSYHVSFTQRPIGAVRVGNDVR